MIIAGEIKRGIFLFLIHFNISCLIGGSTAKARDLRLIECYKCRASKRETKGPISNSIASFLALAAEE
jgi:hypothetical protein